MLKDIIKETESAIDAAYKEMYEKYYIPFVLLIGRADIMPGLNRHYHTDCVIDYQLDRYYDETIIYEFAREIDRDPGIVLGRLLRDKLVPETNMLLKEKLRHSYNVTIS